MSARERFDDADVDGSARAAELHRNVERILGGGTTRVVSPLGGRVLHLEVWGSRRRRRIVGAPLGSPRPTAPRQRRTKWQDRYNAACAYSVFLSTCEGKNEEAIPPGRPVRARPLARKQDLVRAAVDQLRAAIADPRSDFRHDARRWLLDEDPDLANLRRDDAFRNLRAQFFPSASPALPRPRRQQVHDLEADVHLCRLVAAAARRFEESWHERHSRRRHDTHELLEWWEADLRAWSRLADVAKNPRHWQTRRRFRDEVNAGTEPLEVFHQSYADLPIARLLRVTPGSSEQHAQDKAEAFHASTVATLRTLVWTAQAREARATSIVAQLRRADAEGTEPTTVVAQLPEAAAAWQRVADLASVPV
jgi:hypothetical protein